MEEERHVVERKRALQETSPRKSNIYKGYDLWKAKYVLDNDTYVEEDNCLQILVNIFHNFEMTKNN